MHIVIVEDVFEGHVLTYKHLFYMRCLQSQNYKKNFIYIQDIQRASCCHFKYSDWKIFMKSPRHRQITAYKYIYVNLLFQTRVTPNSIPLTSAH